MVCALASLRSERWRLASRLALIAFLMLFVGAAQAAPGRSLLVFPIGGNWVLGPVAQAVSAALPGALEKAGFEPLVVTPDSPYVQLAVGEGWITGDEATSDRLAANRYLLAVLAQADALLAGTVSQADGEVVLEAELAGAIAQRPVTVRVSTAESSDPTWAGEELARKCAAALTADLWARLGVDEAGRKVGAAARYAAGKAVPAPGYRAAAVEFEAAAAGDPGNAGYLIAAAEARLGAGSGEAALARAKAAVALAPNDLDLKERAAQVALLAGRPKQAEVWFGEVIASRPTEAGALEGMARAARAQGDAARSEDYYRRAIAQYPQLRDEPDELATLLAHLSDAGLRLDTVAPEDLMQQAARIYFAGGETAQGVRALNVWLQAGTRPPADDRGYQNWIEGLDEEMERVARGVEDSLRLPRGTEAEIGQVENTLDGLHNRSQRLSDLGHAIRVSDRMDTAHRFRVLAYDALNESNFEALTYARTSDDSHLRRSALLRDAARRAIREAQDLAK